MLLKSIQVLNISCYYYGMKHKRIVLGIAAMVFVFVAVAISVPMLTKSSRTTAPVVSKALPIPAESTFDQVKKLSTGTKPVCLSNSPEAEKQVMSIQTKNYAASFDLVTNMRIIDMPAGKTDVTVHSYEGYEAMGTITFSDPNQAAKVGQLKNFNYTAYYNAKDDVWSLTNFIACGN
jgi:hypothetical protein